MSEVNIPSSSSPQNGEQKIKIQMKQSHIENERKKLIDELLPLEPNKRGRSQKLKTLRRELLNEQKNICFGSLCKGQIQSIEMFRKNRNECKKCYCHRIKEYHNSNNRNYRKVKHQLKFQNKCAQCGLDDINLLEFDHVERNMKEHTISKLFSGKTIIKESKKTQFLCIWHHRLKTQQEKRLLKFGYTDDEENEIVDKKTGQICEGLLCNGKMRLYKHFYFRSDRQTYMNSCKKCISFDGQKKRQACLNYVNSIKLKIGQCQICFKKVEPETTCCFDFDHINRADKVTSVSQMATRNYNLQTINDEINKCRLLCCHCHHYVTRDQLKYHDMQSNPNGQKIPIRVKTDMENDSKPKIPIEPNIDIEKDSKPKIPIKMKIDVEKLKPKHHIQLKQNINKCVTCGIAIHKDATQCPQCYQKSTRVIERPSLAQIYKDLEDLKSYVQVGKKYNVSDNAVRKWIKAYQKLAENTTQSVKKET